MYIFHSKFLAGGRYGELYKVETDGCPKKDEGKYSSTQIPCQPDRKQTVKNCNSNALLKRAKLELLQDPLRNIPNTSKVDLQAEGAQLLMDQQGQIILN